MFEVDLLRAGYSGAPVVQSVRFAIGHGKVLGLLGRNGVGKSTLVKTLVGLVPEIEGRVRLNGTPLVGLPTHKIARLGIGYVPQGRCIFPRLTVLENLNVGTRAAGPGRNEIPDAVFSYFPVLKQRLDQTGGTMSGGEQQMLAIGRALCGRPRVLLMDEPSDGVQPSIVHMIAELIPQIARDTGMSILLVEQNLDLATRATDRCLIMDRGTFIQECSAEELQDAELMKRFLAI